MGQKMATVGNTYYIFNDNGDGMSFNSMGRAISSVKFSNVSLILRNIQNVQVVSILGLAGSNKSDVLFDGQAGVSNLSQRDLSLKAKQLQCLNIVPLRVMRTEEPGLMQIFYVLRPGSVSRNQIASLFEIEKWRNLN